MTPAGAPGGRRRRLVLWGCALTAAGGLALVGAGLAGGAPPPSPTAAQAGPSGIAASASASGSPSPSPSTSVSRPPEQPPADPLPASAPTHVSIPALGIDAGLVDLGLDAGGAMAVPTDGTSIGWYDRSPTPGQVGPTVLAAHVSWDARPAVFFDLATLQVGQPVTVTRTDGASVIYRVTAVQEYPKDAFPTLAVYGNTTDPQLRLITCGGTFDAAVGHHRDNIVVYGVLDRITPA